MKKLLILSGKGGTGKTTTTAAFIKFSNAKAFADCDVDAPNLHIVTNLKSEPTISDYYGSKKAKVNDDKCINCGACGKICRFDAINYINEKAKINEFACEGCGVCVVVCPQNAITMNDDVSGELTLYNDETVFSTAKLKMGRGNSGMLVSKVKSAMIKAQPKTELAIIDGSPGIGCPVIASISGVDLALIVTEPSLSGLSDLKRILKTAEILNTKVAVCINKYDISLKLSEEIKSYIKDKNIPFIGCIPYDKEASIAINEGRSLADVDCAATTALKEVFNKAMELINL